jgi:hypothetical protein
MVVAVVNNKAALYRSLVLIYIDSSYLLIQRLV